MSCIKLQYLPRDILGEIFKFSKLTVFNYRLARFNDVSTTVNMFDLLLETEPYQSTHFELLFLYSNKLLSSNFATKLVEQNRIDIIEFLHRKRVKLRHCFNASTHLENKEVFKWFINNGYVDKNYFKHYYDTLIYSYTSVSIPPELLFMISCFD